MCHSGHYALTLTASMQLFIWHPSQMTYFFSAGKKSKQKSPLEGNALLPTITPF
jgi:hypothetical protein